MKNSVIKKWYFDKGLSKDSYNKNKLMEFYFVNNLLDTLKNYSQFQKCGILKLWKFKVYTFENSKIQNFKNVLPNINGV
jgi:hypothetical protein